MFTGEKLKNLRKSKNLTQKQLAKLLDVDQTYITKIETNALRPTVVMLKALAHELGCSFGDLVGDAGPEAG